MDFNVATFLIGCAVVICAVYFCCRHTTCCKDPSLADDNRPPQRQNDFQALPTSMPMPPSEFRGNQSAPYPPVILPERQLTGFGSASLSNGMPHPADYCPYPRNTRAPYPLGSDDMPHPSRSRPAYSRTRSYSAEDLPPSYAEAVEQQPQVTRTQQRKSTSETSVYNHV